MGVNIRVVIGGPSVGVWNPTDVDGNERVQLGGTSVVATRRI